MQQQFDNYIEGKWVKGQGEGILLRNAINNQVIGNATTQGLDFESILKYGKRQGGEKLRTLTFHARARILKQLGLYLMNRKEEFYQVSFLTGATRKDSWIDIEGGISTLFALSSKARRELPDLPHYVDGKPEMLSKGGTFLGQHICVPLEGVALHINAFNFPVWGMLEKFATSFLAGMPAIVKPATVTCYLANAVVQAIDESKLLPPGSLQLLCGSVGNLFELLDFQDVVTFTGSAETGLKLKSHQRILAQNIRFNMEADSLNCAILGPDVTPSDPEFEIFIKEVVREVTAKAGQKCTAIRRTFVPELLLGDVAKALKSKLEKIQVGDPRLEEVRMGALAGMDQLADVKAKIALLSQGNSLLLDGSHEVKAKGVEKGQGAFIAPTLILCEKADAMENAHSVEAFGPVTTLMPYKNLDHAIELCKRGRGSLVGTLVTKSSEIGAQVTLKTAAYHGRWHLLDSSCAGESTGHGSPMPQLVHGGPGRAGGGEELGGIRGVMHFMQRTAIQGHPTSITAVTRSFIKGAKEISDVIHPFRKYFEELQIGETLLTHKRTVTEADIVNFGNLSWDHFYAHTDETSLQGGLFEKRVAHGYFIISAAAGLFVDPARGPVLANYGLDDLRFLKPVYVGATIGVRLTVKEKINTDRRPDDTVDKGIVKWLVDVFDETGESVALATILTMVQKKVSTI